MPRTLDDQHQDISGHLKARAEGLLELLEAGEIVGFRLDDHTGHPAGPMCGQHFGPFGLKLRFITHAGASGLYLTPGVHEPRLRRLLLKQLCEAIDGTLRARQELDPRSNRWPELVAYAEEDIRPRPRREPVAA